MKPEVGYPWVIAGVFLLLFVLERLLPLRKPARALLGRLLVNLLVSAAAFVVASLLVRPLATSTVQWVSGKPFGLLYLINLSEPPRFALGFLLMDLTFYYWHVANHKIPFLWRFHNVHHIDPDLDVSTGFRFHFGEVAMSAAFRVAQVSLIGVSFATFISYELIFQANTLFHHSNLRLPIRLERVLNKFLVTPRMHGIHHSQVQQENNSNFSVVFPWWDKLHRTLGLHIPQSQIAIGIPGYSQPNDNTFWNTLVMPFQKQRNYWRRPDGSAPERDPSHLKSDRPFLAE